MKTTVLNDLHLGCMRKGGTTPESQAALRVAQYGHLDRLLAGISGNLTINGDFFDGFAVDPSDVILSFQALSDWLHRGAGNLTMLAGNHDWSPRGSKTSSYHLLAHFLKIAYPHKVSAYDYSDGFKKIDDGLWAIPHMPNQSLFDLEINKALDLPVQGWLLLHANYNNTFAQHSDHSLNVSQDQIDALLVKGWSILFGHEHAHKVMRGGRAIIAGNQIPTSCADWLGCDGKFYVEIEDGVANIVPFMEKRDHYVEVAWTELAGYRGEHGFIRVVGAATADQASQVVDSVARFRQSTCALVVSNAVKVDGVAGFDALAETSFEEITSFSVLDALLEELTEEEGKIVKELLEC